MLLTEQQLYQIRQIVEDHHAAFIINAIGQDAVDPKVVQRLKDKGLVNVKVNSIEDSYLYGQILAMMDDPKFAKMSYEQFKSYIQKNPIPLNPIERRAVQFAQIQAGQYCRGLGNLVGATIGSAAIEADAVQRQKLRDTIKTKTAENIARRESLQKLKSELGWATRDWARDWRRIANTEKQNAMQRGVADQYAKRYGGDVSVAKRPMPDACFIPGTPILTQRGEVPIEEVQEGDRVLTHTFKWRKVTATMDRKYSGQIYGFNGRRPSVTENHPVLVNLDWRRADSIQRGDYLVKAVSRISENDPAVSMKDAFLRYISNPGFTVGVPVSSVKLYRYLQMRDSDVNVEFVNGEFRDGRIYREALAELQSFWRSTGESLLSRFGFGALSRRLKRKLAGFPSIVSQRFAFAFGHTLQAGSLSVRTARNDLSPVMEPAFDETARHIEMSRDTLKGMFPGFEHLQHDTFWEAFLGLSHAPHVERCTDVVNDRYIGRVYNLEVERDHSYIADGLVVHNCKHCKRLHIGPDGQPRIFKLSDLEANGTNVGRKASEWKAVVGTVHPHCFTPGTFVTTDQGELPIEKVLPGMRVFSGNAWSMVSHVWASIHQGTVVEVITDRGIITATEEHPFLVGSNWIAAKDLMKGQHLAGFQVEVNGKSVCQSDNVDVPPQTQELPHFASILFGFSRRGGVPQTTIHFHGKAYVREGQIDEKAIYPEVDLRGQSNTPQIVVDPAFIGRFEFTSLPIEGSDEVVPGLAFTPYSSVESGDIGRSLFWREQALPDGLCGGSTSRDESEFTQSSGDGSSTCPKAISDFFYREQLIKVHPLDGGGFDILAFAPHDPSPVGHGVSHTIVDVHSVDYCGLVFNLTVPGPQQFLANGVAVHNCQCQMVRVPTGWGFDEEGSLVPGGELGIQYGSEEDLQLAMLQEMDLQKAFKLQGYTQFQGIPVAIENTVGSIRKWKDGLGGEGQTVMRHAYGYIPRTSGDDEDEIDVFLGPDPRAAQAYIIHQRNVHTDLYDEAKVMLGFSNERDAVAAYKANFERPDFIVTCTPMDMDAFKRWAASTEALPGEMMKAENSGIRFVIPLTDEELAKSGVGKLATEAATSKTTSKAARGPVSGTASNYQAGVKPRAPAPPVEGLKESLENLQTDPEGVKAVRRDKETYHFIEPQRNVFPIELPADFKSDAIESGETEERRKNVDRFLIQNRGVTRNTIDPKDSGNELQKSKNVTPIGGMTPGGYKKVAKGVYIDPEKAAATTGLFDFAKQHGGKVVDHFTDKNIKVLKIPKSLVETLQTFKAQHGLQAEVGVGGKYAMINVTIGEIKSLEKHTPKKPAKEKKEPEKKPVSGVTVPSTKGERQGEITLVPESSLEPPKVAPWLQQRGRAVKAMINGQQMSGTILGADSEGAAVVRVGSQKYRGIPWSDVKPVEKEAPYQPAYAGLPEGSLVRPDARQQKLLDKAMSFDVIGNHKATEYTDWLRKKGQEVYLVGGIVRDLYAGTKPTSKMTDGEVLEKMKDVDIVSTAQPQIGKLMMRKVGPDVENGGMTNDASLWGVVIAGHKGNSVGLDFSSMATKDDLHTMFMNWDHSIEEDTSRRDFTCNSLYYDPHNKVVIDPTGNGIADAQNMVLRLAPSPEDADQNSSLHLRFWKFRARGYSAEAETLKYMRKHAEKHFSLSASKPHVVVKSIYKMVGAKGGDIKKNLANFKAAMKADGCLDLYDKYIAKHEQAIIDYAKKKGK
jgi:hypothetical protein